MIQRRDSTAPGWFPCYADKSYIRRPRTWSVELLSMWRGMIAVDESWAKEARKIPELRQHFRRLL